MVVYKKSIYKNPAKSYIFSLESKYTQLNTQSTLSRIAKVLNNNADIDVYDWSKIDYKTVYFIKRWMIDQNLSPNSINTYLAAVKGVCKELWREKTITYDDYKHIVDAARIRGSRITSGTSFSSSTIEQLIDYCIAKNNPRETRNAAIIALGYGGGLRIGELSAARYEHLNLENGTLKLIGKGNKERLAPIATKSLIILKKWLDHRGDHDGFIFLRFIHSVVKNRGITASSIGQVIRETSKELELSIKPHDLRRSFATNLLSVNIDIFTVQQLMGHANIETTKRYDMRGEDAKIAAVEKLPF